MSCSNNGSGTLNIIGTVNNSIMYSVNDSDNFTSDLSFIDLNVGNHILYVQDEFGCVYSFDFSIDAFVLPSVQVDVENTCEGQSEGVAELLTGAGGMTYSIDGLNFNTDTQIENLGAGSHVIYARDENGCIQELPFNIAIIPMPDLTITSEPSCEALETGSIEVNSSSLDLSYSLDGVNYQDESVFVNIVAGDHSVFVKTNEGCIIERVISIAMVESFIVDFSTAPSCYDEASGSIIVNSEADILCSLDGNVFTSDPIFTNLGAGTHTIYVKDQVGCSQEHSVEILETEPFDLSFETPEVDCSTEELMLGPEINTSNKMLEYKWNNGLDDPFLIVRESGLYTIEVSDECSTESYTWEIQFPEIEQVTEVYVPNVFTPNIAGDNQFFKAFPSQQMEVIEFEFYVFDRWGNRLFLADNFDEGWDGTHLGKDINPGVYVWMYEIEYMDCKEIVRKSGHGDVTIIR